MTYGELLNKTAERKADAIRELNAALNGETGWLVKAEIERNIGSVAWHWLARGFCEELAENMSEIYESADEYEQREIYDIYAAYENDESYLYEILPDEAKLFD